MSTKLRGEDRQAVDLILDRTVQAIRGQDPVFVAPAHTGRVAAVEKLLRMLELMPQVQPANDLIARTLKRVNRDATTAQILDIGEPRQLPQGPAI